MARGVAVKAVHQHQRHTPHELANILDPYEEVNNPLVPQGYTSSIKASDFSGETYAYRRDKDLREYGEYRTCHLIPEAWETIDVKRGIR